jgi:hypothetical protein
LENRKLENPTGIKSWDIPASCYDNGASYTGSR